MDGRDKERDEKIDALLKAAKIGRDYVASCIEDWGVDDQTSEAMKADLAEIDAALAAIQPLAPPPPARAAPHPNRKYPNALSAAEFEARALRQPRSERMLTKYRRVLVDGEDVLKVMQSYGSLSNFEGSMRQWLKLSGPPDIDPPA